MQIFSKFTMQLLTYTSILMMVKRVLQGLILRKKGLPEMSFLKKINICMTIVKSLIILQ